MNIQSVSGLVIGLVLIGFIGYLRWYSSLRFKIFKWIATNIYRNGPTSERLAEGMFNIATSLLLVIGIILVGLSFIYFGIL